jgi:hypothetical protein
MRNNIPVCLMLLLLTACGRGKIDRPVSITPEPDITEIHYQIQVVGPDRTSRKQIVLRAFSRTVYMDGKRSCSKETMSAFGYSIRQTFYKDSAVSVSVADLPFGKFRYPAPEKDTLRQLEPNLLLNGKKEQVIVGYKCRQMILQRRDVRTECWYVPGLLLSDPTNVLIHDDKVPGLILRLENSRIDGFKTVYTVTKLDRKSTVGPAIFVIPTDAIRANDLADALQQERQLFQSEMKKLTPLPWQERDKFLGKWWFRAESDAITNLLIERYGEAYTLSETTITKGKRKETKRGVVQFIGNRLVLEDQPGFRSYFMTEDGRLGLDQYPGVWYKKN